MKKSKRRWIQVFSIIIILGVVISARLLSAGKNPAAAPGAPVPVRAQEPVLRNLEDSFTARGNLESANQVSLLPKVSGSVTAMYAEVGDAVKKGSLLAEIDREVYELDLKRAEAAYLSTSSTWERMDRLYQAGNATRQDWENARAANTAAEAQAAAARLRYSWTLVHSPAEGVVLRKHVNAGSLVAPEAGIPLYTIGSLEDLEVDVQLPEIYYPAFSGRPGGGSGPVPAEVDVPALTGSPAGASLPAVDGNPVSDLHPEVRATAESFPDIPLAVEIRSVSPWVDPQTRSFTVTCGIRPDEASRRFLRPGMLVSVVFVLDVRRDVLTLPESALTAGQWVWQAAGNSNGADQNPVGQAIRRARRMELEKPFTSSGYIVVPDSWAGELFITEGQHFLREGTALRVIESTGDDG